jgi:putative Holliday junction resolvase
LRVLALDIGLRFTGYCFSDESKSIPSKGGVIEGSFEELVDKIRDLVCEQEVEKIIIGVPYSLKGEKTKQTEAVLRIAEEIERALKVSVELVDERLSTVEATRLLHQMQKSTRDKKLINELSARLILESYLKKRR